MPHIHTGPGEYDHAASAVIIRTDGVGPKVLLHMHKKLNRLLQIGGHIELNENPWQAVLHEIEEESGYMPGQLKLLQPHVRIKKLDRTIIHPQPVVHVTHGFANLDHFHTDIVYAFITDSDPIQQPGEGESADLRWFSKNELRRLERSEIYEDTVELCEFILTHTVKDWDIVNLSEFDSGA